MHSPHLQTRESAAVKAANSDGSFYFSNLDESLDASTDLKTDWHTGNNGMLMSNNTCTLRPEELLPVP